MKKGSHPRMVQGRWLGCCVLALARISMAAHDPLDTPAWFQGGQGGAVTAVAVSPDSAWLASASDDATVKVWPATNDTFVRTLAAGTFQATAVAFAPNSTLLAAGYYDGSIRLWNFTNGSLSRTLNVVWTNNSEFPARIHTNLSGKVCSLAFSPDSQYLVSGGADWVTRLWRISTGTQTTNWVKHRGAVLGVAYSPDGATLALGGEDKNLVLLRTSNWSTIATKSHGSNVTALAFSPQGSLLASASLDTTIRLWRTSDWGLDRTLTNTNHGVTALAFATNGQVLFSGDNQGTLKLWNAASNWDAVIGGFLLHTRTIRSLACSPNNTYFISAGDDHMVGMWQTSDCLPLAILTAQTSTVFRVAYSPDGSLQAAAANDGSIRVWHPNTASYQLFPHTNQLSAIVFSPDSTILATAGGCLDNTIKLWRTNGALLRSIPAHSNGVTAIAFAPDSATIASGGDRDEQIIKLWQVSDGALLRSFPGHTNGTGLVAFSPDGQLLASAGQLNDPTVTLWSLTNGPSSTFSTHTGGVASIAFDPSGQWLATAGRQDNLIKVWQTSDLALLCSLTNLSEGARSLAFAPAADVLAAAGSDRIQFWLTSNWQPLWTYTNETVRIDTLSFSPNGAFFLFGREDGTVGRLWNPQAVAPALTLVASQTRGQFTIQNPARSPYLTLQRSLDLVGWTALTNLVTTSTNIEFSDPTAPGVPRRFYRVSTPQ